MAQIGHDWEGTDDHSAWGEGRPCQRERPLLRASAQIPFLLCALPEQVRQPSRRQGNSAHLFAQSVFTDVYEVQDIMLALHRMYSLEREKYIHQIIPLLNIEL